MSYFDIYERRVNRYGTTYQERMQGSREYNFHLYLDKSLYRVDLRYDGEVFPASFERYKQDETRTLHYLLTPTSVEIPPGAILDIPDKDGKEEKWLVYYLEQIKASGYNRYVMLRMTHFVQWEGRDKQDHSSWAYMYGQENNMLQNELRSRSRMNTVYNENLKTSFFIMPLNQFIKRDDYLAVGKKPYQEAYVVTGYDIQSSEGVQYVTVDPVYERDLTPAPERHGDEDAEEFFWLEGGE